MTPTMIAAFLIIFVALAAIGTLVALYLVARRAEQQAPQGPTEAEAMLEVFQFAMQTIAETNQRSARKRKQHH